MRTKIVDISKDVRYVLTYFTIHQNECNWNQALLFSLFAFLALGLALLDLTCYDLCYIWFCKIFILTFFNR